MPLHDIFNKISADKSAREDFVNTLVQFAKRHGIDDADVADFDFEAGMTAKSFGDDDGGMNVSIYRDGPRTSRWVDSG